MTFINALKEFDEKTTLFHQVHSEDFARECRILYIRHKIADEQISETYFTKACKQLQNRRIVAHLLEFDFKNKFLGADVKPYKGSQPRFMRDFFYNQLKKLALTESTSCISNLKFMPARDALKELSSDNFGSQQRFTHVGSNILLSKHSLAVYYFEDISANLGYIMIGNCGGIDNGEADSKYKSGIYMFSLPSQDAKKILNELLEYCNSSHLPRTTKEFYDKLGDTIAPYALSPEYIESPEQKTGNCCWRAIELLVLSHILANQKIEQPNNADWLKNCKKANEIYTGFICEFKKSFLNEYLTEQFNHYQDDEREFCDPRFIACINSQAVYQDPKEYAWLNHLPILKEVVNLFNISTNYMNVNELHENHSYTSGITLIENLKSEFLEDYTIAKKYLDEMALYVSKCTDYSNQKNRAKKILQLYFLTSMVSGSILCSYILRRNSQGPKLLSGAASIVGGIATGFSTLLAFKKANLLPKMPMIPEQPIPPDSELPKTKEVKELYRSLYL